MNKKGFTLIEILAAVAILGILSVVAIVGVNRYILSTRNRAYTQMAKSAYTAAEQYVMDYPSIAADAKKVNIDNGIRYEIGDFSDEKSVDLAKLIEKGYLSSANDPVTKGKSCTGKVYVGKIKSELIGGIDQYIYTIDICCDKYQARHTYTVEQVGGEKKAKEIVDKNTTTCSADGNGDGSGDNVNNNSDGLDGKPTYTVTYSLGGGTVSGNNPKRALVYAADNYDVVPFEVISPKKTGYIFKGWTVHNFRNGTAACSGEPFTNPWDATGIGSDTQVCTPGPDGKTYFVKLKTMQGSTVTLSAVWEEDTSLNTSGTVSEFEMQQMGSVESFKDTYPGTSEALTKLDLKSGNYTIPMKAGNFKVYAYIGKQRGQLEFTDTASLKDDDRDGYADLIEFSEEVTYRNVAQWEFDYSVWCDIYKFKYTPLDTEEGLNLNGTDVKIPTYATSLRTFKIYVNGTSGTDYASEAEFHDDDRDGYVDRITFENAIPLKKINYYYINYSVKSIK